MTIAARVGRLLGQNTGAASLFGVKVEAGTTGFARLRWSKVEAWQEWARLSEGLLRAAQQRDGLESGRSVAVPFPTGPPPPANH